MDFLKIVYQGGQYFYFDNELCLQKFNLKFVNIIIEEAKKYHLKVTAHVAKKADVQELLTTDLYGIEHGIIQEDIDADDKILDQWKRQGAYYVPTLHALKLEHDKSLIQHAMHNFRFIYDKGIKIALGTDNMLEVLSGDVVHKELSYYVEAGLSEMEALVIATRNSAEYLGIIDRTGTVKVGKDADLILLSKNPLEDIENIKNIDMVWKEGIRVFEKNASVKVSLPEYQLNDKKSLNYQDDMARQTGKTGQRTYQLEMVEDTIKIWLAADYTNNEHKKEEFLALKTLVTLEWDYFDETTGNKFHAALENDEVLLTGTFQQKEVTKSYDMKGRLWMQMGEINLATFVTSKEEEIHYFGIGTQGRGALEMTEFTSKKAEFETIEVNGTAYECQKVLTVITKYAFIWTGIGWYDVKTGDLIQYVTKGKKKIH